MPEPKIMILRHGEKPGEPPPPLGIDPAGNEDAQSLSVRGWQRAGALACLFSPWGVAAHPGLAVPTKVFGTNAQTKSRRPAETVTALAATLGLGRPDETFGDGDEEALAKAAMAAALNGPVLISWHHEKIPAIANAILGGDAGCPQRWPRARFDVVWVLDKQASGWAFGQLAQMLLEGDQRALLPMTDPTAAEGPADS